MKLGQEKEPGFEEVSAEMKATQVKWKMGERGGSYG